MIKYGLGTVPYDESTSACDGVGPRIGHRRKIRLLPPCYHLIPSTGRDALPVRPAQHIYTVFFIFPFQTCHADRAGARPYQMQRRMTSVIACEPVSRGSDF